MAHDLMLQIGIEPLTDNPVLRPIVVLENIDGVVSGWVLLRSGDEVYAGTGAVPKGAAPPMVYLEGLTQGCDLGLWRQRPGRM